MRLLLESVKDYAIFTMEEDRTINTWNLGAERMFQYYGAEIIGQPVDILFTPEDRAQGAPQSEACGAVATARSIKKLGLKRPRQHRPHRSGTRVAQGVIVEPLLVHTANIFAVACCCSLGLAMVLTSLLGYPKFPTYDGYPR